MTLDKAIEIVTTHSELILVYANPDLSDAIKLLIEAGKRIIAWRNNNDDDFLWDLPGEAEQLALPEKD